MEGEKLIEEVRKFPVLYDQSDAKYRNAEYKEKVWKIIVDTLKVPGGPEECKKRWASIRDQFRRTLQKRKSKSGQAAAKKQKYKYEEELEFLLPHIVDRETLTNIPSLEDKRDDSEFYISMEEAELDPESEPEIQNEVLQYPGSSFQNTAQPTSPVPPTGCTQANPGKRHHFARPVNVRLRGSNLENPAHESLSSQLMAYVLAEKEAEKNRINLTDPPQHPVDIFLAGLAPILKSLDPVSLNRAKTALFATVQEFELKQLLKNKNRRQITNPLRLDTANCASFCTATGCSNTSHSSSNNGSDLNESITIVKNEQVAVKDEPTEGVMASNLEGAVGSEQDLKKSGKLKIKFH